MFWQKSDVLLLKITIYNVQISVRHLLASGIKCSTNTRSFEHEAIIDMSDILHATEFYMQTYLLWKYQHVFEYQDFGTWWYIILCRIRKELVNKYWYIWYLIENIKFWSEITIQSGYYEMVLVDIWNRKSIAKHVKTAVSTVTCNWRR